MEFEAEIVYLRSKGCSTKDIQTLLNEYFGLERSVRQIQRILQNNLLSTKCLTQESPLTELQSAILQELQGPGSLLGYRSMWLRLKNKYHLTVKRKTVMMLLAILDPHGTKQRKSKRLKRRVYRSKGPNFAWHCDGYDKLKPYGLPIHGCIDGYSRKILWLKVGSSNNDPKVIAHHFLTCVQMLGGCPRVLRTDLGTENSIIAFLQPTLRHYHDDSFSGQHSHIYGKSISNQRIEALWTQLRRYHIEWWISFFKQLIFDGYYNPSVDFHKDCLRYAFGPLIQQELDNFVNEWNNHSIRQSKMAEAPGGKPNVLFEFPELNGVFNYLCAVDEESILGLQSYCIAPSIVCNSFFNLADALATQYHLPPPTTFSNSLQLYFSLIFLLDQL